MALTMSRGFPYALQKASSSVRNNHSHFTNGGKNLYITFVDLMRTHTQTHTILILLPHFSIGFNVAHLVLK